MKTTYHEKREPTKPILIEIARKHLQVETLERRGSNQLDFHDIPVWCIVAALEAAYAAGQASGTKR